MRWVVRGAMVGIMAMQAAAGVTAELRQGGKLLLTRGVSAIEGAGGGGLASWALIGGNATRDGLGAQAHGTYVTLPDYSLRAGGLAVGLFDRFELSYAHQSFDTGKTGAKLGIIAQGNRTADLEQFGRIIIDETFQSAFTQEDLQTLFANDFLSGKQSPTHISIHQI